MGTIRGGIEMNKTNKEWNSIDANHQFPGIVTKYFHTMREDWNEERKELIEELWKLIEFIDKIESEHPELYNFENITGPIGNKLKR